METYATEGASAPSAPQSLTVVYDDRCQLCQRCRAWLEGSAQLVPIGFVASSDRAGVQALGINPAILPVGDELIVIGHVAKGQPEPIWVGPDAFITCLWALADHRQLAARLQKPSMRPVAKTAFHALSRSRGPISGVMGGTVPTTNESTCDTTCRPGMTP